MFHFYLLKHFLSNLYYFFNISSWIFVLVLVFTDNSNAQFCYSVVFYLYNAYWKIKSTEKTFSHSQLQKYWFFNLKSMCKTAGFLPFAVLLARVLNCQFACCDLITRENNGAVKNLLLLNSCLDTQPKEWTLHKFVLVVSIFVYKKHLLCNSGTKRHFYPWDIAALRCASGNNQTCCSLNTEIAIVKIFWTHLFFCHCLFVVKFTFFIIS